MAPHEPASSAAAVPLETAIVRLRVGSAPQLVVAGRAARPGSRRALATAVVLALEGEATRERLCELLWPGADHASARRNLRRDLFRLRALGLALEDRGGDRVAWREPALEWPAPTDQPPAWLQGLEDAGGPELDEWLLQQRERLHRRWLEELAAQATTLERSGDEAAALRLWTAMRSDAVAGPDHEPSRREAQRLHQWLGQHVAARAIGRASTAPVAGRAAPHGVPAGWREMPFTGREALLAEVSGALSRGLLVFLDGAAGAGKTRLALQAAAGHGGVLHVRCRPEDGDDPFSSALRLLDALREAAPEAPLPAWVRQELAAVVPAWAAHAGTAQAEAARSAQSLEPMRRAFDTACIQLARDNFGALVLDDWQWADASSLALWRLDAAADAAWPLARLVVHRAGELPPAALERRRGLIDAGHAVAVHVPNLSREESLALLRTLSGSQGGERFAARLHGATAGNPLFIQETLRHLFARGLLDADPQGRWRTPFDAVTDDYAELTVPSSVRETVLARVRALGPAARRVLEVASLAGDALLPRLLAPAAGVGELEVADALDHAVAADLLVRHAAGGGYRFAHDLLCQCVADSLSPARRVTLHDRLAEQWIVLGGPPGPIARHLGLAQRPADAAAWHVRAAETAAARRARTEALRHYELALQAIDDAARRTAIHLACHALQRALNDSPAAGRSLDAALLEATRVGRTRTLDVMIEAAADRIVHGGGARALLDLEAMLQDPALSDDQRLRAEVEHARALGSQGRQRDALAVLRGLLARSSASALRERLRIVALQANLAGHAGEHAEGDAAAREMLQLCRQTGDSFRASSALSLMGAYARVRGEHAAAEALFRDAIATAREAGNVQEQRASLYNLVTVLTDQGRVDEAEPLIAEAEAVSPFWANAMLRQAFVEARYYLHYLRGHADPARAAAAEVLHSARALGYPHAHVGALRLVFDFFLQLGEHAEAARLLDEAEAVIARTDGLTMRKAEIAVRRFQLRQARAEHAAAWAQLHEERGRVDRLAPDDRVRWWATALQVALDADDLALARALRESSEDTQGCTIEVQALLQAAWLRWACAVREGIDATLAQTRALQCNPHLPRFEAALLERALNAAAPATAAR